VHIQTIVLRGKFSAKIATEQQPPNHYTQLDSRKKKKSLIKCHWAKLNNRKEDNENYN